MDRDLPPELERAATLLLRGLRQRVDMQARGGVAHGMIESGTGELYAQVQAQRAPDRAGGERSRASAPDMQRPAVNQARTPAAAAHALPQSFTPVVKPSPALEALRAAGGSQADALIPIAEKVAGCASCRLCESRTFTVFSRGNPKSPLMLIGEAPGADEDEAGLPFVGRAGKLLDDIIEKGMKYPPDDVYIANVLKCRPPNNRNPEPDEIEACRGYLQQQIDIVNPLVILALGRFPAQWLLESTQPIGKLRGKIWDRQGRKIVATYHPAYLLRNPAAKKDVWHDVQLVMDFFGRDKPLPMR